MSDYLEIPDDLGDKIIQVHIGADDWVPMSKLVDFNTPTITRRVRLRLWLARKLIPKDWVVSNGPWTWIKLGTDTE